MTSRRPTLNPLTLSSEIRSPLSSVRFIQWQAVSISGSAAATHDWPRSVWSAHRLTPI